MENQNSFMSIIKRLAAKCSKVLLGFLGVSVIGCGVSTSCRVMYGSPYADYEIKGKVVNEKNEPIKGIVVVPNPRYFESGEYGVDEAGHYDFGAVTADDGTFYMSGTHGGYPDSLYAVDVDSIANGGYFQTTGVKLEMTQTVVPGKDDNDWYSGVFESQDMLFVMKEKTEDTQEE